MIKKYVTLFFTINVIFTLILIALNTSVANNKHTFRRVFCIPRWSLHKRGAAYHQRLHEAQGGLANVTWHLAMGWSSRDHSWSPQPPTPPSPACLPPSEFTPWLFSLVTELPERSKRRPTPVAHMTSSLPFKMSTATSARWGPPHFPACLLTLASAPTRPLVDPSICPCAGSSLTHECRQGRACCSLDANRRQRICNSNLWPTLSYPRPPNTHTHTHQPPHPPQLCILGLELSPAWLRMKRGDGERDMYIHTFMHVHRTREGRCYISGR